MTRIAVFGGTFDPPHCFHAFAVMWALMTGEVDEVLVVPSNRHAFGKKPVASFNHRLEMCRLTMKHFRKCTVKVTNIEQRLNISYMLDTLKAVQEHQPGNKLRLLIGSDVFDEIDRWHYADEVMRLAPPLVVPRDKDGVSSTAVRAELLAGDFGSALPTRVAQYIRNHGLYSGSDDAVAVAAQHHVGGQERDV